MSDLIDRKIAIDVVCKVCEVPNIYKCKGRNTAFKWCEEITALRQIPSIEPKQGKWVDIVEMDSGGYPFKVGVCCSECGFETLSEDNYCSYCGVKMEAEE